MHAAQSANATMYTADGHRILTFVRVWTSDGEAGTVAWTEQLGPRFDVIVFRDGDYVRVSQTSRQVRVFHPITHEGA